MTVPLGPVVNAVDLAALPGPLTEIGAAFMPGIFDAGPLGPIGSRTYPDLVAVRGARVPATAAAHDTARNMFDQGASVVYHDRLTGPASTLSADGTTGSDDRANVNGTTKAAALARFTRDLGPGVGVIPGAETAADAGLLDAWAAPVQSGGTDRLYKIDAPDLSDQTACITFATALRALSNVDRCWPAYGHGLTSQDGVSRTVSLAGNHAALEARNDARGVVPNQPAMGRFGIADTLTGLTRPTPSDIDWTALVNAGLNIYKPTLNDVRPRAYGNRTPADPALKPLGKFYASARLRMLFSWKFYAIAEDYFGLLLDKGHIVDQQLRSDMAEVTSPFQEVGAIGNVAIVVTSTINGSVIKLTGNLAYEDAFAAELVTVNMTRTVEV